MSLRNIRQYEYDFIEDVTFNPNFRFRGNRLRQFFYLNDDRSLIVGIGDGNIDSWAVFIFKRTYFLNGKPRYNVYAMSDFYLFMDLYYMIKDFTHITKKQWFMFGEKIKNYANNEEPILLWDCRHAVTFTDGSEGFVEFKRKLRKMENGAIEMIRNMSNELGSTFVEKEDIFMWGVVFYCLCLASLISFFNF